MPFKLPKLPYSYQELEPYIDKRTMDIHYNKHHGTYTNNLNKSIAGTNMVDLPIEEILKQEAKNNITIRNNGGGFYNHNIFWEILIPHSKFTPPSTYLNEVFKKNFQSFHHLKNEFSNVALKHFGSGWIWLCIKEYKLTICSTMNQDSPIMCGIGCCEGIPILGLDVWEHAYYLNYQNRRIDYISSFWKIINWKKVEDNYKKLIIK
ncbi:superoxide dismutase [Blattabacterium cuenoti]|uniref:superoxide dismutase n=1 Tax=Blattabacterium cuenoti TaxID=1653831 RepID=UPI00163BDDC3|nr:superoxide dismutase [Blattabacterium cuenoti]